MKKEAFVKLIDSLMDDQVRREKLNEKMSDLIQTRAGSGGEKIDLRDLIYDCLLEDAIIDMIELEFGPYGRDRVACHVYEQHDVFDDCAGCGRIRDAGELYDEITKNQKNV